MALTFTSATSYPTAFDECKAMILEVYSALKKTPPLSLDAMKLNFSLRVLTYRLAKHCCPLSWDDQDKMMIRSFEFAFPEFTINIEQADQRHKLCTCISASEKCENEKKVTAMTAAIEAIGEAVTATDVDEEADEEEDSNKDESDCTDEDTGFFGPSVADQNIQFGDVDFQEYEDESSSEDTSSPNTSHELTSSIPSEVINLSEASAIILAEVASTEKRDDPVAAVRAIQFAGVNKERFLNTGDDLTEIVVVHRKFGVHFELWDEERQIITSREQLPTIMELQSILRPLHYTEDHIWSIYFTWRRMNGVKFPDRIMDGSLRELSILSTHCDAAKFLL